MHHRATDLIATLALQPHPEGGWYRRLHTSALQVQPGDGRGARAALTLIHYLLVAGTHSRWHRVRSDECWHWCEGAPLELLVAAPDSGEIERVQLGPFDAQSRPVHVVPAGRWQAARPLGDFTLVACSVGPGFDFADFELLTDVPSDERPRFDPGELL